jgi:hypothetical protein
VTRAFLSWADLSLAASACTCQSHSRRACKMHSPSNGHGPLCVYGRIARRVASVAGRRSSWESPTMFHVERRRRRGRRAVSAQAVLAERCHDIAPSLSISRATRGCRSNSVLIASPKSAGWSSRLHVVWVEADSGGRRERSHGPFDRLAADLISNRPEDTSRHGESASTGAGVTQAMRPVRGDRIPVAAPTSWNPSAYGFRRGRESGQGAGLAGQLATGLVRRRELSCIPCRDGCVPRNPEAAFHLRPGCGSVRLGIDALAATADVPRGTPVHQERPGFGPADLPGSGITKHAFSNGPRIAISPWFHAVTGVQTP